jgi:hypothetical protein
LVPVIHAATKMLQEEQRYPGVLSPPAASKPNSSCLHVLGWGCCVRMHRRRKILFWFTVLDVSACATKEQMRRCQAKRILAPSSAARGTHPSILLAPCWRRTATHRTRYGCPSDRHAHANSKRVRRRLPSGFR